MSIPHVKLTYFNIGTRGFGEVVKQFLQDSGASHEYIRIEKDETWPAKREQLIEDGDVFGAVPFIEYEGKIYGGSTPILRFLSKKLGKYHGTNDDDEHYIDMAADFSKDWHITSLKALFSQDQAVKETFVNVDEPKHYERFERVYGLRGGPYLMGDEITYADFLVYHNIDNDGRRYKLEKYPNLDKFVKAYEARPNLKEYISTLPVHPTVL
ncbi:class gamma glutathione S-transferase [Fennellomyces sp. T-0311]|nr:class gamma glutathione S-transferase [Fennellomyces sp. T-0311]